MEVDLVFTSELQFIKLKVISSNGISFDITDNSNKAKGVAPIPTSMLEKL
jgi:hypothetical protein